MYTYCEAIIKKPSKLYYTNTLCKLSSNNVKESSILNKAFVVSFDDVANPSLICVY